MGSAPLFPDLFDQRADTPTPPPKAQQALSVVSLKNKVRFVDGEGYSLAVYDVSGRYNERELIYKSYNEC